MPSRHGSPSFLNREYYRSLTFCYVLTRGTFSQYTFVTQSRSESRLESSIPGWTYPVGINPVLILEHSNLEQGYSKKYQSRKTSRRFGC